MKFTSIFKVAAVFSAICGLMLTSCEEPGQSDGILGVSVRNSSVDSGKGQQFVTVKCSGSWTLALVSDEGDVDWASLSDTSGSGDKNNVVLSYDANEGEEDRTLKIYLDNGSRSVYCDFEQLSAGERPEEDPEDKEQDVTDPASVGWLELPAMDNPDLGYYSHSFEMNGATYRNYTFGWSQEDRVALWVAYPLCKLYTNGSVGRTGAWALDPLLGDDSSAPFGGYAGDYARGHQIPSADRQCCYDANAQTFYGTNITPQLNAHNEGIWQDLENKVRNIANLSDTTYVITGVMVSAASKKEADSYDNAVTIPDAYFKAVLKYSKSSTLGQWNAAAFYLEHRNYSESLGKDHAMSVDELEEITGMDLFANLPAMLGEAKAAQIEAADPTTSSVWW